MVEEGSDPPCLLREETVGSSDSELRTSCKGAVPLPLSSHLEGLERRGCLDCLVASCRPEPDPALEHLLLGPHPEPLRQFLASAGLLPEPSSDASPLRLPHNRQLPLAEGWPGDRWASHSRLEHRCR